jgi:1-acyl-sn-glycerol-3-phosphate acyltransferase
MENTTEQHCRMIGREGAMAVSDRPSAASRPQRKTWVDEQSKFWFGVAVVIVGLIFRFWVRRYRVIGAEKIPASGGAFVIANHTTGMDPFLLGYPLAKRMPWGPGKTELFKNPLFAYFMRKIGIFPLRQDIVDAGAVRTMITLYRKGKIVIVYPEGGRSPATEMKPFNPDFARLAIRMHATLVPAAVAGGAELLPIGKRFLKSNTPVVVVFGDPFELSDYYSRELTSEVAAEAAADLRSRVSALRETARHEREKL